jgi:hypothetical protein
MTNTYKLKNIEIADGLVEILEMTDTNGVVSTVPMVAGNSDYEAYLNKDTLPSKLSIPSTPQAGA